MLSIKVFRMNDCDWWAAATLEEAKADYLKTTLIEADDDSRELRPDEMENLKYFLDDEEHVSFATQLENIVAAKDSTFPCMFASTEY